jgi:membrane DNA delivery protein
MSDLEKIMVAIVGVALVTTLVLPKRNTASVLTAGGTAISSVLGTAING